MEGVKKDVRLKEFWSQNERFADLFNAVMFNGKQVKRCGTISYTGTGCS